MTEQQEKEKLPTAAKVTSVGGTPQEGAAIQNFVQITEGDELVRRRDVEQFLKKRMNAYTDEDGELREDLTKVEYGRYRELKKQLQEVQD